MHDWLKFVANFHILSFLLPQHLLVCLQLLSPLPFLFCHHLSSVAMDLKSLLLKLLLFFTLLLLVMGTCIVMGKEEREREREDSAVRMAGVSQAVLASLLASWSATALAMRSSSLLSSCFLWPTSRSHILCCWLWN